MTSAQRQEEVRDRLLEAVEGLAAGGEGLGDVSVERLAKAAGISRATFYIYFADKGDLLSARFEQVMEELMGAAGDWWRRGEGISLDQLRGDLRRVVDVYRRHSTLIAAIYDEAAYNPEVRALASELIHSGVSGLREHIERGQREGFVDPDLLDPETGTWLGWMIERGLRDVVVPAPEEEVDALIDAQADVIWHTLYVFEPAGAAR